MDQLIPSLVVLVEGFPPCFRHEVFLTFQHIFVGWIICPGPRTISEVWQATGRAASHHHDTAYSLFSSAVWEWDELGKILLLLIVTRLMPTGTIWLVVDDTLCHKRGAKVAFGGFFLDAVIPMVAQTVFAVIVAVVLLAHLACRWRDAPPQMRSPVGSIRPGPRGTPKKDLARRRRRFRAGWAVCIAGVVIAVLGCAAQLVAAGGGWDLPVSGLLATCAGAVVVEIGGHRILGWAREVGSSTNTSNNDTYTSEAEADSGGRDE